MKLINVLFCILTDYSELIYPNISWLNKYKTQAIFCRGKGIGVVSRVHSIFPVGKKKKRLTFSILILGGMFTSPKLTLCTFVGVVHPPFS